MNLSKAKGMRRPAWPAWLAWLALVASLLAAAPGAAQAQDGSGDDPLDVLPDIHRAERDPDEPYSSIIVEWTWSYPSSNADYTLEVELSDDGGDTWTDFAGQRAVEGDVQQTIDTDPETGDVVITLDGYLRHSELSPGDTFHYRVRVVAGATLAPWATVGPVSTKSLPEMAPPTGFTAVPWSSDGEEGDATSEQPENTPQNTIVVSWDWPRLSQEVLDVIDGPDPLAFLYFRLEMFSTETLSWERVHELLVHNVYEHSPVELDVGWSYRVWAGLDFDELGKSESEKVETSLIPSQPPAPTGVSASIDSDEPATAVVIEWDALPGEAGSALRYELRFLEVSSGWETIPELISATTYTHRDRTPETVLSYQVRALREGIETRQWSEWSDTASVLTAPIGGL